MLKNIKYINCHKCIIAHFIKAKAQSSTKNRLINVDIIKKEKKKCIIIINYIVM